MELENIYNIAKKLDIDEKYVGVSMSDAEQQLQATSRFPDWNRRGPQVSGMSARKIV